MERFFLNIRILSPLIVALSALLLIAGCGDNEGSEADANGGEIVVETGSLSKSEFSNRANIICESSKGKALSGFNKILKERAETIFTPQEESAQLVEYADTVIVPVYEDLIGEISELGAPRSAEKKVTAFLTVLKRELSYVEERPVDALERLTPFKKAGKAAEASGLDGCADSLT
jgi:hypothetical protein